MRKIHECAEDIKNILNDAERTEEVDGDMLCSINELVDDGLVAKTIYPELPPRSEYSITELGQSLLPILDAMITWGEANRKLFVKKYGQK